MGIAGVAARVSELATRQWGLVTTAQAEAAGITRLQLARLAEAGVMERIERGIYVTPAAVDERTPVRAAWLSLAPSILADERLAEPIASGVISHTSAAALYEVGDLLDDEPEFTVSHRKQSRRGIRLHRGRLTPAEVTIRAGLPVTTPSRTVVDLLRDGHDPSHVAEIAGEILRRDLAPQQEMAAALDPLAQRNGQESGAALLEYLLDLVGLSSTALAIKVAESALGRALIESGQLSGIRGVLDAVARRTIPTSALLPSMAAFLQTAQESVEAPKVPADALAKIDISSVLDAAHFANPVGVEILRKAMNDAIPAWRPRSAQSMLNNQETDES